MKAIIVGLLTLCVTATGWSQSGALQEARVPDRLPSQIYRAQKRPATCWAACNSMLLAAERINSSEEDQIRRMSQFMPDAGLNGAGAHFLTASRALEGRYGSREVGVWFRDRRTDNDPGMNAQFVAMLESGQPVMIATPQHGMVAIAVRYARQPNGNVFIAAIEVLDPNPSSGRRRWLPPMELANVFGFMAIER
jgi:hypothetical protein